MKRFYLLFITTIAGLMLMTAMAAADTDPPSDEVNKLEDLVVEEKGGAPGITVSPTETVIELDKFSTIGQPDSVLDVLKTQAAIDFRGENDLDPGVDSIYLRGFDSSRFVTALDGMTLQKTGGRKSTNIVDYSMLPAFLIDKIEILPGPHSAMYDAKAIGGVLNFISRAPKRRDSLKPDVALTAGYSSYETFSSTMSVQGAVSAVTYDLAYRKYRTDGYLRNSENDMDTVYGRLGLVLPNDGWVTFSASYSDVDRNALVNNPSNDGTDYDSGYPETSGSLFNPDQEPTWDSRSTNFRLNYEQSLPIGRVGLGAFYGNDNRDRTYYVNAGDATKTHMDTDWWQQGGKITDEISWAPNHTTTVGYDLVQMFDDQPEDHSKRMNKQGFFLQHRWGIVPPLEVKVGARYEDLKIWIYDNVSGTLDPPRHFSDLMPKSFTTWHLDPLAPWLRDTSLSAGISKIWHAPDAHGTYNARGRPIGRTLDPEHGVGYDLILDRRLWRDIALKIDFSYYEIDDFIASGENWDEVHRQGVDVELGGHLIDDLSFYITYAWQDFDYKGDDSTGHTSVDQRAEHRVGAGLRYALFENTLLLLDYAYQSDEVTERWETDPVTGYDVYIGDQEIDAYSVFDFGIQQTLFKRLGCFNNAVVSVYVKNLFDEEYSNSTGYPALDRTFGASFSIDL